MTNSKNTKLLVAIIGAVLIAAIAASPLMMAQNAQAQSRKLTCDTTKDCNIIIRRLRVGDDLIIQFKAAPPATGGGGGGSGGPTEAVDQQARDDITQLKSTDAQHTNDIQRLQQENQALQTENAGLKSNITTLNDGYLQLTDAVQELQVAVSNITDANPFVDLNVTQPGGNESGQGEQPTTPSENETGGAPTNGENQTTTPPVGGNESQTTPPDNTTAPIEPVENQTTTPSPSPCNPDQIYNETTGACETPQLPPGPAENQTGGETPVETPGEGTNVTIPGEGNVTLPGGSNVTLPGGEGNITLPGEGGNVTVPGDTNVTLPIDNSTGDIQVSDNETNLIENATSGQDIIDFTGNQ